LTCGRGPVTSHLKAIKKWYESTDEQYTFFCEDDLSLDTVKYWNFTWSDFFNKLPANWKCVQLCLVSDDVFYFYKNGLKMRYRCFNDWSGCAYLITREHAKNLIENYYFDDTFYLEYKGNDKEYRSSLENAYWFLLPHIENLVFTQFYSEKSYSIYTIPLFLENVFLFDSTWTPKDANTLNKNSYNQVLNWWQTKGKEIEIDELMLL
jgi:GR25 family glycosyltransferase involved in LPS biosynthesis